MEATENGNKNRRGKGQQTGKTIVQHNVGDNNKTERRQEKTVKDAKPQQNNKSKVKRQKKTILARQLTTHK